MTWWLAESDPRHPVNLSPEERRQRFADEFARAGIEPLMRGPKTAAELEADAKLERLARADEARDLSPQVWPRR